MIQSALMWLVKFILEYLLGYAKDEIKAIVKEKQAVKADEQTAADAVSEIQKPHDPSLPVAERERLEENAFDRFRSKLRRKR